MVSPIDEKAELPSHPARLNLSSDDDYTVVGDGSVRNTSPSRPRANSHLTVATSSHGLANSHSLQSLNSPAATREEAHRLEDDLAMLKVEQEVTQENESQSNEGDGPLRAHSLRKTRTRRDEPADDFDINTNPTHFQAKAFKPPESPTTSLAKVFKKIHNSSFLVRYFFYITPIVLVILIPLLLGALLFKSASVGGVRLIWFCIWLEIVWLTLWAGRLLAKSLPYPVGLVASLFTNNDKKWRDMAKQLELAATLFFWWLAIEISFLPTMINHHVDGSKATKHWEGVMNKVLVSLFIGAILNFVEKIIIQLIAISFHLRTYQDRIEVNKFQIGSLVKLYDFSKKRIAMEDREFEEAPEGAGSGTRTPAQLVKDVQKNTKEAFNKFGDFAGKIAGDFTGRAVATSTHPHQVVLTLLGSTQGSQVLARRLYRTFAREGTEAVDSNDLRNAFENDEEADAAFTMFDKDMNGDICMEELEAVCVEIGRERKSITASLKDLDSVVSKLDSVFMFIIFVITVLVFISLISTSAAGVLTSAGSTILALSWLFSATAQEFLQSCVFVFVKHPFDVGDRVGIYGNTGALGKGDDYLVKEISLLYTEFKKLEGHVVQAPNSYLNTLFILNQRRSGGLAEAVPVVIKFGTTLEQIDQLRIRLLDFVKSEKREYQPNILTELREVTEAHSLTLNIVFFYKSNWQNELLRLQRRNKFICAMMVSFQELEIEGPRMRYPGMKESFPVYLQNVPHVASTNVGNGGTPNNPNGDLFDPLIVPEAGPFRSPNPAVDQGSLPRSTSTRARGESLAAMGRRVDFSLGMKDISSADITGDIFEDRARPHIPINLPSPSFPRSSLDRVRDSSEMSRSSSHDLHGHRLQRMGTDSSASQSRASHRNRFFSRNRAHPDDEELAMSDIPEDSRMSSAERLDARSGLVSSRAVRVSSDESTIVRDPPRPLNASGEDDHRHYPAPRRAATHQF